MQLPGTPSSPNTKNKKIHPEKILYFSGNGNFLYFLKRKLFLYFRKQKPWKNSLYFRKGNFLYILGSGSGNPSSPPPPPKKKSLYFKKLNFLIFQETETLKNFLYFTGELPVSRNEKNSLLKCFSYFGK